MSDYLVDFPGLGIFDIPINRTIVEFDIFGRHFSIYWYGVLIAIAFLLCIYLSMRHAPKFGMSQDQIADYYLLIIPLALVGARIYYVVFEWDTYKGDLMRILDLRSGGLAFYGGVIGGALAIMIMAAFKKHKISRIFDFIAVYLPLGHAIGRWGNFFNQEAFGVNTDLPWGMYSNGTQEYLSSLSVGQRRMLPNLDVTKPVHPTFLYEFVANIIIFVILLQIRKRSKRPFTTLASYFLMYGIVRFVVEGLRTDSLYFAGTDIRVSQLLSALMIITALIYLVISGIIKQRHPERAVTVAIPVSELPEAEGSDTEDSAVESAGSGTEGEDNVSKGEDTGSGDADAETDCKDSEPVGEDLAPAGEDAAGASATKEVDNEAIQPEIPVDDASITDEVITENDNDTIYEEGVIHAASAGDEREPDEDDD